MNEQSGTEGTTPIRAGFEFDIASLERWLTEHVSGFRGPMSVSQFNGGQSNPTYLIETPDARFVLRRKPAGTLLKGAHAIEREAQVLQALEAASFPVPHVYALCTDESVIGTWFYVMAMLEGRIFWDAAVPTASMSERAALFDAMNATIAHLHRVDYVRHGLEEFGRPGNYFERQIRRWSGQYQGDVEAGQDATMDRVIAWLEANIPPDDGLVSVIHGDFRIDNMIFHPARPEIIGVLDWELSTLGHPGADFAYHAMMYHMPPHIVAGLGGVTIAGTGIPTEEEYLAAYCRRTDRSDMPDYPFYRAFNFFRLAAIFHGIKGRVLRGTASSAQAHDRVKVLPELIELAWQQTLLADRARS